MKKYIPISGLIKDDEAKKILKILYMPNLAIKRIMHEQVSQLREHNIIIDYPLLWYLLQVQAQVQAVGNPVFHWSRL